MLPFTLWFAELAMARLPRPSVALVVPPRILIVPPFSVSALAAMLIPSASRSAGSTMCSKVRMKPVAVWAARRAAWAVAPIVNASVGAAVTSTARSKPIRTWIASPDV